MLFSCRPRGVKCHRVIVVLIVETKVLNQEDDIISQSVCKIKAISL